MSKRGRRVRCCVEGCLSKSSENKDLIFYKLPSASKANVTRTNLFGEQGNVDRLTQWLKVLKIQNPVSSMRVCSLHFKSTDYRELLPELPTIRPALLMTAVPSLNLPMTDKEKENEKRNLARLKRLINRRLSQQDKNPCPPFISNNALMANNTACLGNILQESQTENVDVRQCASDDVGNNLSSSDQPFADTDRELVTVNVDVRQCASDDVGNDLSSSDQPFANTDRKLVTVNVDVRQCASDHVGNDLSNDDQPFANTDRELVTVNVEPSDDNNKDNYEGSHPCREEEPDVVDAYIDFMQDPVLALISKQNKNKNNEKPIYKFTDTLDSDEKMCTITDSATLKILDTIVELIKSVHGNQFDNKDFSTRDEIILTYMKLKHNLSYRFLAIIFQFNNGQKCEKIFKQMIPTLSNILSVAISWPSVEEIRKNLPACFKTFEDTRIVLDCTEIFIQSSSKLCCQMNTFSSYKHAETVKFMVGVSPAGLITFVSKSYGGRHSDTAIFSQSDLVNMLEPGDAVMVDRGFLISELCIKNRWKLHRPPYLGEKEQFSKQESTNTASVAPARVHIERVNQRIKAWAIGGSKMPASLVYMADEIMMVLCGTVSLSNPVLSDDKFIKI